MGFKHTVLTAAAMNLPGSQESLTFRAPSLVWAPSKTNEGPGSVFRRSHVFKNLPK